MSNPFSGELVEPPALSTPPALAGDHAYDVRTREIGPQRVLEHRTPGSMALALSCEQPDGRVFVYGALGAFSVNQSVAFVAGGEGDVHYHSETIYPSREQQQQQQTRIAAMDALLDGLQASEHAQTGGTIRVDEEGNVYRVYADSPLAGEGDKSGTDSLTHWIEDVHAASATNPEGGRLHVLRHGNKIVVGFVQGRRQWLVTLTAGEKPSLEDVTAQLPLLATQTNFIGEAGPTEAWQNIFDIKTTPRRRRR